MGLLFHTDSINERGVSLSTANYISGLQKRGFDCKWAFDSKNKSNHRGAIEYYNHKFDVIPYSNFNSFAAMAQKEFEWVYFQKSGENDGKSVPKIYNAVHSVFSIWEPHGDSYAYISEWLARTVSRLPDSRFVGGARRRITNPFTLRKFVPYSINMLASGLTLREELEIPESAFLCLAIGGKTSFDIPWVHQEIREKIEKNRDFYFVGLNIQPFFQHKRALFLSTVLDEKYKTMLIESADVLIHGRRLGESFGLTLLEAMQLQTPILSWRGGRDRNHIRILEKTNLYRDIRDLREKLTREYVSQMHTAVRVNFDRAALFRPQRIIPLFMRTFEISETHTGGSS